MEDESFEVRVKRLFGSNLFASIPSSASPNPSWSVAAGDVERRQWNRGRTDAPDRDADPCASAFDDTDGCFANKSRGSRNRRRDLDDVDDHEDDDDGDEEGGEYGEREERDIRSSIGLDPTLDREEEEDEFDRAAFHKENAGDRVYMREINNHGPNMNYHTIIDDQWSDSIEEIHRHQKDPRADHFAASVRLKEDQKAVEGCHPLPAHHTEDVAADSQSKLRDFDANLKPILKRRGNQITSKPKKHVRFDTGCKDNGDEVFEEPQNVHMVPESVETTGVVEEDQMLPECPRQSSGVPDYIRNPSKYTRYTFDVSSNDDDDDAMNKCAFEDFRNLVKRSNPEHLLHDSAIDLPKSVTFTPRKKADDPMVMDDKLGATQGEMFGQVLARTTGIASGEADDNEVNDMENHDVDASITDTRIRARKQVRQYRSKSSADDAT